MITKGYRKERGHLAMQRSTGSQKKIKSCLWAKWERHIFSFHKVFKMWRERENPHPLDSPQKNTFNMVMYTPSVTFPWTLQQIWMQIFITPVKMMYCGEIICDWYKIGVLSKHAILSWRFPQMLSHDQDMDIF